MFSDISHVIKPALLEICQRLGTTMLKDHYYLAGGTGLTLQIKHRSAEDLEFYSLNQPSAQEAVAIFRLLKLVFPQHTIRIDLKLSNKLDIFIKNTKLSFTAYDYPLLNPLIEGSCIASELTGLKLASTQEIALMNALNIIRKPSFKDYVDLYFLLQTASIDLPYILNNANRKFVSNSEKDFSTKLFLERLRNTQDLNDKSDALSKIVGDPLCPQEVEAYLASAVLEYSKNQLLRKP